MPITAKSTFLALLACTAISIPVFGEDHWPDSLTCAAGVHAYFYLKEPPKQLAHAGDWYVYRSASGATYDCQIQQQSIMLKWKNGSGVMKSESSRFTRSGHVLIVQPKGLSPWRFRRTSSSYRQLD